MPINYQNGKVYKIICNVTGLKYIGSTCRNLSARLTDHKSHYKVGKNMASSRLVLENNNFCIILIEDFPCDRKEELLKRERFHIENNVCVNKNIPGRTQTEYQSVNKEAITEYQAEYQVVNKEKIAEKSAEYRAVNKEKIAKNKAEYNAVNKEKIAKNKAKYYSVNKEAMTKYSAEYQENNKEAILKKQAEKVNCVCCSLTYTKSNKSTHYKRYHPVIDA